MARGINKVILVGNLGADPDVRYSAAGNAVTRINIATSEAWRDKQSGKQQERTEWHRVVFFGRLAEIAGEYLKKGQQAYIEGSLRTSSYEKEGQKHYATDIIANEMQMLGGRPASQRSSADDYRAASQGGQPSTTAPDGVDDDIPF